MKLKSKRTQEEFKVLSNENGIYLIELKDGSLKELAESTVTRWYSIGLETVDDLEENTITQEPIKEVKKTEPKSIDVNLVKKAEKPKKVKSISNKEFKSKVALLLTEYIHSLDLKINKKKEYVAAYTANKKKVVEIRSGRKGIKVAVRPMVYLNLENNEQKRCFYLNERANMHFRTTMEINSIQDLDLAKKLISLSLMDLEG